jgi:rhodanese-related sulfurtransferase
MSLEKIIKENKGTIVDVRTYSEFMGGNVVDSINIPLNEIPERVEELKKAESTFGTVLRLWKQKWTGAKLPFRTRNRVL